MSLTVVLLLTLEHAQRTSLFNRRDDLMADVARNSVIDIPRSTDPEMGKSVTFCVSGFCRDEIRSLTETN